MPVLDGSEYRAELERLHRRGLRALRALRSWRKPRTVAGRRELFGSTYSETALGEIVHLGVGRGGRSLVPAVSWLASSEPTRQRAVFDSIATAGPGNRFEVAELEAEWDRIGDILPDVGLVETLVAMVEARG